MKFSPSYKMRRQCHHFTDFIANPVKTSVVITQISIEWFLYDPLTLTELI